MGGQGVCGGDGIEDEWVGERVGGWMGGWVGGWTGGVWWGWNRG